MSDEISGSFPARMFPPSLISLLPFFYFAVSTPPLPPLQFPNRSTLLDNQHQVQSTGRYLNTLHKQAMTDRVDKKKSKRRRRDRDRDDEDAPARGSGVNYSKVSDRHVDDERFEKHRQASSAPSAANAPKAASSAPPQQKAAPVSSQMQAVMRLMAGMEERTISEKLADSNRPTWEQYKKDNQDKLDISGVDQKKMDAYRKELDEQRDKLLTRGTNHREDGGGGKKASKKKKKKRHRSHRDDDSYSSDDNSSDSYSSDDRRSRKRSKKHKKKSSRKKSSRKYDSDSYSDDGDRKKSSKHKKKKDKKRKKGDGGDDDSGSGGSYRLSSFFTKGSDEEDSR